MNVLIPVHCFPPESRYGAELYTFYLAKELQSLGVGVHAFFPRRGEAGADPPSGLDCTVVDFPKAGGPGGLDRPREEVEAAFRGLLTRLRPDVVHVNHLLYLSTGLPGLAQGAGSRVVFTLHDYWIRCPKVKLLDWWGRRCTSATDWACASCCRPRYSRLTWPSSESDPGGRAGFPRRVLKEACFQATERIPAWWRIRSRQREMRRMVDAVDRFIAPVRFLADRMTEWGIPPSKIVQCDYGTMELPYAARDEANRPARPRFGYVGGATRVKGLHVLLEAFGGIDEADLVIYGGDREALRGEFGTLVDRPNVECGGMIDDAQKARLLPRLDALIVPSIWYENSPLVIHEAFRAGVPVICSGIGGMAELVTDGVDGLHFQVERPEDLRRVLLRCVREDGLLGRLRRGVRPPRGMREHVRDEILPLYESLCRQGRRPAIAGLAR